MRSEQPGFVSVIFSVLAALFGVQTEANRQRDFSKGSPAKFIAVGVIFIVAFVLLLLLVVSWVLP
ncbi:DUF2970 domain-containing protein [Pseudidiomarina insulisalsae]|uniref:DUF2970 domain-containing protein n=1 Tax=Pseudidiomarina insulisalsae TaxID=575789 RepID=A0A432YQ55_9GAMM|nr:DUF2970 domain-containing protein [Pseudidiomarina insulisalsae]RUO63535.1 DUF2970 domain-containing protein [Pseudidiomarina insulisalsae]